MEQSKPVSRAKGRNWMGTHNNPTVPAEDFLKSLHQVGVTYVVGQLESGEEGTEHIQFYINLDKPQALSYVKKLCPRSHWELARCDDASRKYVMKEDTRVSGPWEFGSRPQDKHNREEIKDRRNARAEANKAIIDMGAEQAVIQGFADIKDYSFLERSINMFKLKTAVHQDQEDVRGVWIWGNTGVGKSHIAHNAFGKVYKKA